MGHKGPVCKAWFIGTVKAGTQCKSINQSINQSAVWHR